MKNLSLIILLFSITLSTFAEKGLSEEKKSTQSESKSTSVTNSTSADEIVINHALIEKFNNAEFSSEQISFATLVKDFSFQEIKQISLAYRNGDIEVLDSSSIEQFRKEKLNNDTWLQLYSEAVVPKNIE